MPDELNHPKKGLINIQNYDNKCFVSCHVGNLNLVDKNPQRITKRDSEVFKKRNYQGVNFPVSKKDYGRIEILNKICINVFYYENKTVYPVCLSDQSFNDCLDLLLISSGFTSHYVYIKDFNRLTFNNTKHKGKKYFVKIVYSVLGVKKC